MLHPTFLCGSLPTILLSIPDITLKELNQHFSRNNNKISLISKVVTNIVYGTKFFSLALFTPSYIAINL